MGFLRRSSKKKEGGTSTAGGKKRFSFGKNRSKNSVISSNSSAATPSGATVATAEPQTPLSAVSPGREGDGSVVITPAESNTQKQEIGNAEADSSSTPSAPRNSITRILDELNVLVSDGYGTEMYIGALPPPASVEDDNDKDENMAEQRTTGEDDEEQSPTQAEGAVVVVEQTENAVVTRGAVSSDSPLDAKETKAEDETVPASQDATDDVSRKLLGVFCSDDAICSPEMLEQIVPNECTSPKHEETKEEAPIVVSTDQSIQKKSTFYSDHFATKFLDEMLNVGFALVHHQAVDDDDWIGRTVTMVLKPGVCNAVHVMAPRLEWSTMGGGTQTSIETRFVSLLNIHSVTTSQDVADEMKEDAEFDLDDDDQVHGNKADDDMDCYFTITTNDSGDVYVFEALSTDECQRLVVGIKNLSARLSNLLISGDERVLREFYDSYGEAEDIKFSSDEAMVRLSHSFFDG